MHYYDSTIVGAGTQPLYIQDSELYDSGSYANGGGNTILQSLPNPPTLPTHSQLDAIWAP